MLTAAAVLVSALADTATPARACGAESLYTRVPVYVRVTVARSADTVAAQGLLLIAEAVAARIRAAVGGSPDSLPRGDALLPIPHAAAAVGTRVIDVDSAGLRVVAWRDGALRWTPRPSLAVPLIALLDRVLTEAKQADETFIPRDVFPADSVVFTLGYVSPTDVVGGRLVARPYGPVTLAAFTQRAALEKQVAAVPGTLRAPYPEAARYRGANAVVRLTFVVDTTGRAVVSTIHDVWPNDRPRLVGELGRYYGYFVESATEGVLGARFYPAEIAGCKVKQLVSLPFTFTMAR